MSFAPQNEVMQALVDLTSQKALSLWFEAIADSVRRRGPDLSARQMAIVLSVYMQPPPHTVRGMSAALAISKPAVTRALDALAKLGARRILPTAVPSSSSARSRARCS